MNREQDKFQKIIEELCRKYDVETTVTTGSFLIVPVGRKRHGESGTQSVSRSPSKKRATSGDTGSSKTP